MSWARGQRLPVSDLGVTDELHLGLGARPDRFDVVVAGLEADETLVDSGFLLSRHQPESFEGSVRIGPGEGADATLVHVRLGRVPASVHTLRVVLIGQGTTSADDLEDAWVRVLVAGREAAVWQFSGADLSGERAIIVADLYRRDGWRLALHGTGYRAGLRAFLESIDGGTRLPGSPPAAPPAPPPPPSPVPPGGPPADLPPVAAPPAGPPTWSPQPAPRGPARPTARGGRRSLRTGLSFRERLFSRPVARALASPSGLALATGGAVAGGTGAFAASLPVLLGAVGLGGAAWAGRALVAVPGRRGEKIDPFSLREPWRHFVADAVEAHRTFDAVVGRTPEGPLHDRLAEIGERLDEGRRECWTIASRGDAMGEARRAIDDGAARAELAQLHAVPGAHEPAARARLAEALQSQIDAADRLDGVIDRTYDQLRLLDARMDNAVARALEISATADGSSSVGTLGVEVDGLVDDLEALRQGLDEVRGIQPG